MARFPLSAATAALLAALVAAASARAAESFDNCTGYITVLPAVIDTQGIWCMTKDLTTTMTRGAAITVGANNVTIDCNHFKLGGLAAGMGTGTFGIFSPHRANTTVRRCNVRGFAIGFSTELGEGGHLIEDNRFDGNTVIGIQVGGAGSMVRRNQVLHTGGNTLGYDVFAIGASDAVQILDNQVQGVINGSSGSAVYGILMVSAPGGRIAGNSIGGVAHQTSASLAVHVRLSPAVVIRDNEVFGTGAPGSYGFYCTSALAILRDNSVLDVQYPITGCSNVTGNYSF